MNLFAQFVLKNCNKIIAISAFPNMLKDATLRPIYKKDSRNEVQNHGLMSTVCNLPKVNVCLMKWQLTFTIFCQNIILIQKKIRLSTVSTRAC